MYHGNTQWKSPHRESVQSEKDLGVTFDSKLNFIEHISSKVKKANQIVGFIFKTFTFMDKEMFLNLFKSLVHHTSGICDNNLGTNT